VVPPPLTNLLNRSTATLREVQDEDESTAGEGTGVDIAKVDGYLIVADHVTGSILPVDGGFTVA
jgi:hypothetical protein